MGSTSSFPRSIDTSLASFPGRALHPICSSHCWSIRELLFNLNSLTCTPRAIGAIGKAMGIWVSPATVSDRISGSLAKPRPLAQPKTLLFPWFAPDFSNRGGWGENLAPARLSPCPLPTRRRAETVVPGRGRNSDCAQKRPPRLGRGSAARRASYPPECGSRRADSSAAVFESWRGMSP
jgi:hypothetical protein